MKRAGGQVCRWCRAPLAERAGPGRPKRYCRPACRQAAYRARHLAAGHGLGDDEVVVRVEAIDALGDAQYVLVTAIEDAELDLAEARTITDLRAAVDHLLDACRPLADLRLRAVTDH